MKMTRHLVSEIRHLVSEIRRLVSETKVLVSGTRHLVILTKRRVSQTRRSVKKTGGRVKFTKRLVCETRRFVCETKTVRKDGREAHAGPRGLGDRDESTCSKIDTCFTTYYLVLIRSWNSRDLLRALEADGWTVKHQVGSHVQLVHPTKPGKVTLPHPKKDLAIGTVRSILKQAGLAMEVL